MIEQIGFYGKLPCFGDFIKRNVSPDILTKWDEWLNPALEQAKIQLKDNWQACYLNAPIWRFILPKNSLDEQSMAGIMMPSVDKVGRFYCFSILIKLHAADSHVKLVHLLNEYLSQLEDFAISLLEHSELDLEQVQQELEQSAHEFKPEFQLDAAAAQSKCAGEIASIGIHDGSDINQSLAAMLDKLLLRNAVTFTVWWTDGSQYQLPQLRVFSSMPSADCFHTFLESEQPQ